MEIKICSGREEIGRLAALADEIWHEYFKSLLAPEQIDYMVEKFQSEKALAKAIEEDGYLYFLACEDGALIGYCGVRPEEERLFLSKLYLKKEYRGRGLASRLLDRAFETAKEQKKRAVYLTCNKYNKNSLEIYRAKGFRQIDAVQTEIGQGFIMDDYVMEREL